jgi:hypothetical protein
MRHLLVIRSKALLMLVVFAANFYTVCHCAPVVSPHRHSCCGDRSQEKTANPKNTVPCKDGCTHAHSIKFNLLEKQTSAPVGVYPPFTAVLPAFVMPAGDLSAVLLPSSIQKERFRRHIPPDRLAFYQCFLI